MSEKNNKDLTRIEDLGEFLHELNDETQNYLDVPEIPADATNPGGELPDLPEESAEFSSDEVPAFPTEDAAPPEAPTDEDTSFESSESFTTGEENNFSSDTNSDFSSEGSFEVSAESFESSAESPQEESFGETSFTTEETPAEEESFTTEHSPEDESAASAEEPTQFTGSYDEPADSSFAPDSTMDESTSSDPLANISASIDDAANMLAQNIDESKTNDSSPSMEYTPKEDFSETRQFAEKALLDDSPSECNPAYSVIARNIRFLEDSEEILSLLKEVGFPHDMMDQFKKQIARGTLLIPRISEFTAIYVCHRLRRFRLELTMGLSDMIHAPKKPTEHDKGLVSRKSIGQNQHHQFEFKASTEEAKNIILSTLAQLDGHAIERYLGVASEHTFLASEVVENETAEAIHKSYDELAQKLKGHALHHRANAVVGINYQLTPMPAEGALGQYRYKLTCTGNLVWAHKISV